MLLLYRLSGWSQDIVLLIIVYMMIRRFSYWKGYRSFFFWYICIITFLEIVYGVSAILMTNNLFLNHIYQPVEFIFLGFFLKGIIAKRWADVLIPIMTVLFLSYHVFSIFNLAKTDKFDGYESLVNSIYLIILSGMSLFLIFKEHPNQSLFKYPIPWLVLGIFFIYTTVVFFDYLYNLVLGYGSNDWLYAVLISQNFLKTCLLFFFVRGVSIISLDKRINQ